jgi:phosphate starvation-inducible protein PhoH and related proteins
VRASVNAKKKKDRAPVAEAREAVFECKNGRMLQSLVGESDANLRTIERELEIRVSHHPDGLVLKGQDSDVELAYDLLFQLKGLVEKGETLFPGDLERSIRLLAQDRHVSLEDMFREHIVISGRKHSIVPKTPNQKQYIEAIRSHDLVFGVGPAGTGKTYLAMAMALSALTWRKRSILICARSMMRCMIWSITSVVRS